MEIKRLVSKYVYRIEPKPEGGFIAHASDPGAPTLEAPTRMELQQKIQSTILAGLSTDFPGLKLPPQSRELKFSFHVERQPDGSFDVHSSDPNSGPINAASHDQVESHFLEKLISFAGKHMLPEASEALRAQLTSGDIKVFINKSSGFSVSTSHDSGSLTASPAATTPQLSGTIDASSDSPIHPVSESGGRLWIVLVVMFLLVLGAYFFSTSRAKARR